MTKIYITREIPEEGLKLLVAKGYEIDMNKKDLPPTKRQIIKALKKKKYDGVVTLLTDQIDKDVFEACPTAKIFANFAVGYNNLDIVEAKKKNVVITNTPGNFSFCIAEHTIALMLALSTRIVEADKFVRKGKYKGWSPINFIGTDLRGRILGLVGAGHIGEEVALMASKGFNMKVIYHDVVRNEKIEKEYNAEYKNTLEEVLQQSDFVSLHTPLLAETHHLINAEKIKLMKKTAFLINTSRGPIIDEKALVHALKNNTIKGAGLDVFEFEPKFAKGLLKLSNVVLTPHIASARESARREMAELVASNIISFFEKGFAPNQVNK